MTLGTRRYLSMMVDEAMLSIVTGTPPRAAVHAILARALADQAKVAEIVVGSLAIKEGGNLDMLEDYYSELVEAARGISKEWAILPSEMKYDLPSVKTWLIRYMGVQIKALNKALADLAEGRRR